MKKILSFLLVVFLAVTLFATASCKDNNPSQTSSQTSSVSSESNSSEEGTLPPVPSSSATDSKPSSSDSSSSGGTVTPTPKPSTEIVGSWTCVSFKVDGTEMLSTYSAEGLSFVATFYDDWTCSYGVLQGSKTSFLFVEGTFTVNGNTINAVCEEQTYVFTLDSDGFLIQTETSSSQTSVSKFQKGLLAPTAANKFIGYWNCTSFLMGNENLLSYAGIKASFNVSSSGCTFTFEEGSTSKATYGTYTVNGNSLIFTPSDPSQQPVTFTLNEKGELVCNTTFESSSTVITLYRGSLTPVPPMLSSKYLGVWELDKTYENSVETPNENKITVALLPDQTIIYALEDSSGMEGLEGTYYVSGNDVVWQIMGVNVPCHVNDDGKIVATVQSGEVTTTMEFVKTSSTNVREDVVGEYNIYSYFVDGEDQTYSSSNVKITLNSNGSATYTTKSGTENGKYFVNGNTVVLAISRHYVAIAFTVQTNGDLSLTTSSSSQTTSITWRKNYVAPPALTLSDMVGKWQLKKFTYNGTEQTLSYSETIEFKSDDTVTFTTTSGTNVSTKNGTYTLYGTTVNITVNGSTVTYTVTDGVLFCAQQSGANTYTMQYEKSVSATKVNYAGTWELEKIVVGGQQQNLSVSQNVIINANGTFSIVTVSNGETVPAILNGTYVIGGNTITLTPSQGDALTLQFDGEKLVSFIQDKSEESQGQIVYKKGVVSSSSIVGTYDYVSLVMDGAEKITGDGNYGGTYVFNADGTFTLDETYNGNEESYGGYYVLNGTSLTLLHVGNYGNFYVYLTIDASGNLVEFSNDYYVISQKEDATAPADANIVGQWTNVSLLVEGEETIDVDNAMHIEFTADGKVFTSSSYVVSGNVIAVTISDGTVYFILDANGDLVGKMPTVDGNYTFTFKKGDITPVSSARHDVVGTWDSVSIYVDGEQLTDFTSRYTFFDDGTVVYKEFYSNYDPYSNYSPYEIVGIYEIRLGGVMVYLNIMPHFMEFVDGGKLYEFFNDYVLYQATFQKQAVVPSPTPSDVVGTWKLEKILLNGTEQAAAYTQTFTFKADDTVKLTITSPSGTVTKSGTFVVDGTTINVTVYGSTSTLTLSQGKLVLTQQNGNDTITMIFKSQHSSSVTPTINITGTYNYTSYIVDGVEKIDENGYSGTVTFNADNTFSLEETVDSVTKSYSGYYVINGTRVIACDEDGKYFEFVIDADKNIVNAFVAEDENNNCHSQIITAKAENSTASQNADFVGSWKMTSSFIDCMENASPSCSDYSISLAQDGTFTTYSFGSAFDSGTYEVLGNVAFATSSDLSWVFALILDYDGNLIEFIYYYFTEGYQLDVATYEKGDDVSVTPVVPSNLVGTWTSIDDDGEYTFYQDGKVSVTFNGNTVNGVYLFKNDEIKVLVDDVISLSLDKNGFLIQGSVPNKNVFKKQVKDFVGSWKFDGSQDLSFTSELTVTDDGEFAWTVSTSATESNTTRGTYVAYDDTIILVDSDGVFLAIMYIDGSDELTYYCVSSGLYASAVHEKQPNVLLSEIVGTWNCYRLVSDDVDQSSVNISYTFNNDGTVVETYNGVDSNGTFTILGNVINIRGSLPYEISFVYTAGKTLELCGLDSLLTLKKSSPASIDLVGTWHCVEYIHNDVSVRFDMSVEFKKDGTLVWSESGDSDDGTYSVSDNVVTITVLGNTLSFTLGADETMFCQTIVNGNVMSCVLQKEFSFIGTWNLINYKVNGTEQSTLPTITITFFANNTLIVIEQSGTINGTYTVENGVATATIERNTLVFTQNHDRTISYTLNSVEGTLKKQGSTSTSLADVIVGTWINATYGGDIVYEFYSNGSVTLTIVATSYNGTYVVSGNSVTATISDNTYTLTLNEQGKLIDGDFVFEKQSTTSLADVIVGKWTHTSMGIIIFKFNADGSVTLNDNGDVYNGTYIVSGNSVTATIGDYTHTLTLNEQGKLIDGDFVFEKQSTTSLADVIVGNWTHTSMGIIIFTFNTDGSVTLNDNGDVYNGTYVVSGNSVTATIGDYTHTLTLNAQGNLIDDADNTFVKQTTSIPLTQITGIWIYVNNSDATLTFDANGKATLAVGGNRINGTFAIVGDVVVVTLKTVPSSFIFKLNGADNLVEVVDNLVFTKQTSLTKADVVGEWIISKRYKQGEKQYIDKIYVLTLTDDDYYAVYDGDVSIIDGPYRLIGSSIFLLADDDVYGFTISYDGQLINIQPDYDSEYNFITICKKTLYTANVVGTWGQESYVESGVTKDFYYTENVVFYDDGTFTLTGIEFYSDNPYIYNYYGTYVTYANVVTLYEGNSYFTHFTIDKNGNLVEKGKFYDDEYFVRTYANISSLVGTWNLGQYLVDDEEQQLTFTQKITFNGNGTFTMSYTSDSTHSLNGTYVVNNSTIKLYENGSLFYTLTLDENGILYAEDFNESTSILTVRKYDKEFDLVGIWELKNYTENGVDKPFTFAQTVEFKADGTLILTTSDDESGVINGTYSIVGNAIKVYEGPNLIATLSLVNDRLTLIQTATLNAQGELIDYGYVFEKQSTTSLADVIVGNWTHTSMGIIIFKFNADGSVTLNDNGDVYNGTYIVSGNSVTATIGDYTHTLTLNAQGKLIDGDFVFEKQSTTSLADVIVGTWINVTYGGDVVYEFYSNGSVTLTIGAMSYNGTYVVSGNSVTATISDYTTYTLTLNEQGNLVDAVEGIVFTKQSSSSTSLADVIVGTWIDITYGDVVYEFYSDGSVTLTLGTISYNGTYVISDNTVTAWLGGDMDTFTLNAQGNLVVNYGYVFEKQSSSPSSFTFKTGVHS